MIRKKPTKKEKEKLIRPPHINLGGHLPYPPEGCSATRDYDWEGIEYIDRTACAHCKHKPKCQRLKEFENEWKEYWDIYQKIYNKYKSQTVVVENGDDSTT